MAVLQGAGVSTLTCSRWCCDTAGASQRLSVQGLPGLTLSRPAAVAGAATAAATAASLQPASRALSPSSDPTSPRTQPLRVRHPPGRVRQLLPRARRSGRQEARSGHDPVHVRACNNIPRVRVRGVGATPNPHGGVAGYRQAAGRQERRLVAPRLVRAYLRGGAASGSRWRGAAGRTG